MAANNRHEFLEHIVHTRLSAIADVTVLQGFTPAKLTTYPSPWLWLDISDGATTPVTDGSNRPIPHQKSGRAPFKCYMGKSVSADTGDAGKTLRICWQMQWDLERHLEKRLCEDITIDGLQITVTGIVATGFTLAPDDDKRMALVMVTGDVYFTQRDLNNTDF